MASRVQIEEAEAALAAAAVKVEALEQELRAARVEKARAQSHLRDLRLGAKPSEKLAATEAAKEIVRNHTIKCLSVLKGDSNDCEKVEIETECGQHYSLSVLTLADIARIEREYGLNTDERDRLRAIAERARHEEYDEPGNQSG